MAMGSMETKKIRFIDSRYKPLFEIEDGGKVIVEASWGEKFLLTCKYIDDCHFEADGRYTYHICEFAKKMGKNHAKCYPAIADVTYISCWDGEETIETAAKLNRMTGEIFDIETKEVGNQNEICTGEFIRFSEGNIEEIVANDQNQYFLISALLKPEDYQTINQNNTEYRFSKNRAFEEIQSYCL